MFSTYGYLMVYLLFFVGAVLVNSYKLRETGIVKVFLALYIIIFTFRGSEVGFDYSNYITVFNRGKNISLDNYLTKISWMEKGYLLLNKLVISIGGDIRLLQFIIITVFSVIVYKFMVRYTKSPLTALFLLYGMGCLFTPMNILRAIFSVVLCMLAFERAEDQKWVKSIIWILVALTFHTSAIIGIIIIILFKFKPKVSVKNMLKIGLLSIVVVKEFDILLDIGLRLLPKYEVYFGQDKMGYVKGGSISYFIVFIAFFIFAYHFRKNFVLEVNSSEDGQGEAIRELEIYDTLLWINVFGIVIATLSVQLSLMNRFMFLPLFMSCILITKAIRSIKNPGTRLLFYLAIIVCVIGYSYIYLYVAENGFGRDGVVPYLFYKM